MLKTKLSKSLRKKLVIFIKKYKYIRLKKWWLWKKKKKVKNFFLLKRQVPAIQEKMQRLFILLTFFLIDLLQTNILILNKSLMSWFKHNKIIQDELRLIFKKRFYLRYARFFEILLLVQHVILFQTPILLSEYLNRIIHFQWRSQFFFIRNLLNFFKLLYHFKPLIKAFRFTLHGPYKRHGRTLKFTYNIGSFSLQRFLQIITYEYLQWYTLYGSVGLKFWLAFKETFEFDTAYLKLIKDVLLEIERMRKLLLAEREPKKSREPVLYVIVK